MVLVYLSLIPLGGGGFEQHLCIFHKLLDDFSISLRGTKKGEIRMQNEFGVIHHVVKTVESKGKHLECRVGANSLEKKF